MFQSSPNPKVACHSLMATFSAGISTFQSSPNPKVGCHSMSCTTGIPVVADVSILTQPEGWVPYVLHRATYPPHTQTFQSSPNPKVGCHDDPGIRLGAILQVSILTQPEGWVPCGLNATGDSDWLFQSSPNPKVGCHSGRHSSGRPYATVSILTQAEGWLPSRKRRHLIRR